MAQGEPEIVAEQRRVRFIEREKCRGCSCFAGFLGCLDLEMDHTEEVTHREEGFESGLEGERLSGHQLRWCFKSHTGEVTEGVSLGRNEMGTRAEPVEATRRPRPRTQRRAARASRERQPRCQRCRTLSARNGLWSSHGLRGNDQGEAVIRP